MKRALGTLSMVLLMLLSARAMADDAKGDRVRVLVDRSHQWLFAYDDLGQRMLRPAGFEVVLCDASLGARGRLADFDIVVVPQGTTPFDYSKDEIRVLKEYVRAGGRLLIAGSPNCPIAKVAFEFGFTLRSWPCRLPLRPEPWLRDSFRADPMLQTKPMSFAVETSTKAKKVRKVICDQNGMAVAMIRDWEKGKVLCFADDLTYWDFCAQRDKDLRVPNVATTVALFRCLVPEKRPLNEGPTVVAIPAEHELVVRDFLLVRYSNPIARESKALLDHELLLKLADLVAQASGGLPPADRIVVNVLAGSGGGYSGGREVGVPCSGSKASIIAVIAHELTHSWEGPLPAIVGEGWASTVGMRAATAFGFKKEAEEERRSWREAHENAERDGKKLDITLAEKDRTLVRASEGKMMWMIEQMEAEYGADFMPRFLEITHALKGRVQRPTIQEVLYFFSLAAGRDLSGMYRTLGITCEPPSAISAKELEDRLASYRRQVMEELRKKKEDPEAMLEYRRLRHQLANDRWHEEWRVSDNLVRQNTWIADPSAVPTNLSYVQLPETTGRKGFLVVHAAKPDVPCRIERTCDVPITGKAALYIGGAKRLDGGPSVLRLSIGDEVVWRRGLTQDGWFHAKVDLSKWAGRQVALKLESDTQGEWGYREVLIDYLIILSDGRP